MRVSDQQQAPAALTPRNNTVSYWTRGVMAPEPGWGFWGREKVLTLSGLELQVVQPVA